MWPICDPYSGKPPLDPAVRDAKRLTFEAKLKAIGMQSRAPAGQTQVIKQS